MSDEITTTAQNETLQSDYSRQDIEALQGEEVPDREAMSLVNANVAVPVDAAVAANVLTNQSTANASATQDAPIHQSNVG